MGAAHTYTQPHEAEQRRRLVRCPIAMHAQKKSRDDGRPPAPAAFVRLFCLVFQRLLCLIRVWPRAHAAATVIKVWQQRPIIIYGS